MNIWFLVWLFIALVLLYFMGWNLLILWRQKRLWKAFAQDKDLRYVPGRFSDTPEISGSMDDYTVSIFAGEHPSPDARGSRKLTAIEVQLSSIMPFECGVASGGMVPFVQEFGFNEEVKVENELWKTDYIAASSTPFALSNYLTKKRVEALLALVRVKNAWVILVFRGDVALLRFDTPDALDSGKKLEALVNRMIKVAKVLELEAGEASSLKSDMARKSPKEKAIQVSDEDLDASSGLSLEEDENEEGDEEMDALNRSTPIPENPTDETD